MNIDYRQLHNIWSRCGTGYRSNIGTFAGWRKVVKKDRFDDEFSFEFVYGNAAEDPLLVDDGGIQEFFDDFKVKK